METLFPFGFPLATSFYLSLYVLTLVIHVVFMNYVLAGTVYLAAVHFFSGGSSVGRHREALAEVLKDWMPLALGATITAGVAPLLFIQILYKEHFYTANLLLFHRWMAILPVLIIGFYFLYLLKSQWMKKANPIWGGMIALGAWFCFGFTGYSWTENHLLSIQRELWPAFYGSDAIFFRDPELLPRLSVWFFGAMPNMALLAGWQLCIQKTTSKENEARRLAGIALVGLSLSALAVAWYFAVLDQGQRLDLVWKAAGLYFVLALVGAAVQTASWVGIWKHGRLTSRFLGFASIGGLFAVLGMTVVREVLRLSRLNIEALFALHAKAASVGGLAVFLIFLVINTLLIGWCIQVVKKGAGSALSD